MLRGRAWARRAWKALGARRRLAWLLRLRRQVAAMRLDGSRLRFFINVVHELRTPLALVDGPLQQLARIPGLPREAREYVGVARQNCQRLMNIAEDLLDLSRLDRGQLRLAPATIELDAWLHSLCSALVHHPGLGGARVVTQLAAGSALVFVDANALERVVLNLVSNAIKFSGGRGDIVIGTRAEARRVELFVADQGIGIAPEHQAGIFERFRQVDGSLTRRYGGVGIGLALVRELARAMGGQVAVLSAAGAGSRFTVSLPREPGVGVPAAAARLQPTRHRREPAALERWLRRTLVEMEDGAAEARNQAAAVGLRPRVLLVEDEPELRWLIGRALRDEFDVRSAPDAEAARGALAEAEPDVLLTDWMLPGIDGLSLAEQIRSAGHACKLVLITAHMDDAQRVDALRRGVDDFLRKPFSLAELRARLRNLALAVQGERELRAANASLAQANRELAAVRAALIQDEKLKSIGLLSAGLLHEINNPVNFMRTAAELLRSEPPIQSSPRALELTDTIEDGLRRVATIIGDLRVFAFRGSAAERPVPGTTEGRELFDLGDAVGVAIRLCAHELRHARVSRRLAPCRALGSQGQIIQVLVNLLTNAAAATRDAARTGHILVEAGPVDGGRLRVRVRDNGVGIDADAMARLFEPFFTTKEAGQGLGLGLAMSHAIVRAHGGRLRADSIPGRGSSFEFDLPQARKIPVPA